ncbi:23S rRNA (guanosine(2251)-2'-O)-methyltransferase [hydrothermal vent metagenome]|uniref:23S rRNA (Guanosine(2251)-2'-O)-methyltransferase n=1 Tax=hydrothermal vent metagenome TaxID=652676 RepID=A0A3B1CXE8_9ZZZZ
MKQKRRQSRDRGSARNREPAKSREIIFGVNPIVEALRVGRRKFHRIVIKKGVKKSGATAQIIDTAKRKKIQVDYADIDAIAKMAQAEGHQGIVAAVSPVSFISFDKLISSASSSDNQTLAILDGIMDPRNFGAILRSAEAFGIDGVIFPSRKAASYTPVAAKASAGAGERIKLCRVNNIAETVKLLRDEGYECIAFDSSATNVFTKAKPGPVAVVLGGEGEGVRPLVAKRCNQTARIEMKGTIGSLNVSSAAAIIFHIVASRS